MTTLATASFLAFGTLLVLFGANASELLASQNLDYAALGLLGSMLSLGLGTGIAIAGPIVDRLPHRPLFIASLLLVILATTTLGPDQSYERLLVNTVAIGLGAGFYETILNAIIIERFAEAAGRRLLFIHCGAALAACIVPIFITLARTYFALKWFETFWIAGLLHVPLVVAACFVSMARTPGREMRNTLRAGVRLPGGDRDHLALAAICVATFAYVGVESALTIFVADHASVDLGLDASRAARTISAFWGGLLVGRLASGLSPRAPGAGINALLAFVGAGIMLAFGLGRIAEPEIAMGMVGLVLGGVFPVMIGLAGRALPASPATAVGLAGGFGSLGGFLVPWYTGHLASTNGLSLAIAALGGWLLLLSVAATWAQFRQPS